MFDDVARHVLSAILDRAGFVTVRAAPTGRLVADHVNAEIVVDVLVTKPSPASMQEALDQFATGHVRSVVELDRPEQVIRALQLLDDGLFLLPAAIHDLALAMPRLDQRARRIWQAVMGDQSNSSIAAAIGLSTITVKRLVARLCLAADAGSRLELAAAGYRLGLEPRPLRR